MFNSVDVAVTDANLLKSSEVAVEPLNEFNSAAVDVIAVPFNVKLPVDKLVNVPTEVIFG